MCWPNWSAVESLHDVRRNEAHVDRGPIIDGPQAREGKIIQDLPVAAALRLAWPSPFMAGTPIEARMAMMIITTINSMEREGFTPSPNAAGKAACDCRQPLAGPGFDPPLIRLPSRAHVKTMPGDASVARIAPHYFQLRMFLLALLFAEARSSAKPSGPIDQTMTVPRYS